MEKILFDKNHIKVTSCDLKYKSQEKWRINWVTTGTRDIIYQSGMTITETKEKLEDVVKESPLGFYYLTKEKVKYEEETNLPVSIFYHIIYITLGEISYKIQYLVSCNDVKIGFDARPWDICIGDKAMSEHFIKTLQKILDDIFARAASIKHWERTKEKIYTELFGNPKGYTTLDNEIKIVSHGFDPKESFRKRKMVSAKTKRKKKKNEALKEVCSNIQ